MKTLKLVANGTSPLLMHSDRTANVLDRISSEIKKSTSKRIKTEDDYNEIALLEFIASSYYRGNENELYLQKSVGLTNGWYMPASNILATLKNAGRNFKLGKRFEQSVNILTDPKFEFKDSKLQPIELFKIGSYTDIRTVKVQQSKLMRCRPIFENWKINFELLFDENMMDEAQLDQIFEFAGNCIGLCDYRPRFGRFELKKVS